jgi:polynucleotide 5'-kinase involved in rRNA processing
MRGDAEVRAAGCVINTCGWIDGGGQEAIQLIATSFRVDRILVIDNERLLHELQQTASTMVRTLSASNARHPLTVFAVRQSPMPVVSAFPKSPGELPNLVAG